jgi:hypothetical protein
MKRVVIKIERVNRVGGRTTYTDTLKGKKLHVSSQQYKRYTYMLKLGKISWIDPAI